MACFRVTLKNYCGVPNCEYSHDVGLVAAARDVKITVKLNAKRAGQVVHQSTLKAFEKDGAKSFKQSGRTIQPKPSNPAISTHSPTISLLTHSPGPQLDQHIGRKHECYQRIALLSRHIPANILSQGCQTEVVLLCASTDLIVQAMLNTGCSPGNYISKAFYKSNITMLKEFLVSSPAKRVGLATSDSAKQITEHLFIEVRHVDSRGMTRTLKLRFDFLDGLLLT